MTDHRITSADQAIDTGYRGRFAPTPSGPLHLGSLLTALASWLQARSKNGSWLLRMDDLDRPRCVRGMDAEILRQLEDHGLYWDEAPRYQSQHVGEYEAALQQLTADGRVYACVCTRAQLEQTSLPGPDGPVYAGTCRERQLPGNARHALRYRVGASTVEFHDGCCGVQRRRLDTEIGDFTLQRSDGMIGYQLACTIDEHAQHISEVVRGADLLGSTFRQIELMRALDIPPPQYRHGPVLKDERGQKLSKQNHATPIQAATAGENLLTCLTRLDQDPPAALAGAAPPLVLNWAIRHWRPQAVQCIPGTTVEQW